MGSSRTATMRPTLILAIFLAFANLSCGKHYLIESHGGWKKSNPRRISEKGVDYSDDDAGGKSEHDLLGNFWKKFGKLNPLLGKTVEEAEAFLKKEEIMIDGHRISEIRIVKKDGVDLPMSQDLSDSRVDVEVEKNKIVKGKFKNYG